MPILLLVLFAALTVCGAEKPHIVFILADDLGWADVGWHGKELKTPHLDQLAQAGARLEQFYVQPVCSPTRAALMTGRYPMRHGLQTGVVRPWSDYGLPLEERTLAQALKSAGYTTALCGKWHLGHFQRAYLPTQRGFDHQYGHYNGAIDYFEHTREEGFDWHRDDKVARDEGYSTALIGREAVRLIRAQPAEKPLFLYIAFNAVHAPHQVPDKYKEPFSHLAEPRRTYAGMLAAMDEAIGQVVSTLDEKNMRRNTLIIFSSDNGGPNPGKVTSNGPLRAGKATLYEGGVRVAAFATWPARIQPGTIVNQPIHMVDWYPTLAGLTGAAADQKLPLDGVDIWPTITAGKPRARDEILINTEPHRGAIRVGDWKLIINGSRAAEDDETPQPAKKGKKARKQDGGETLELFNLADDPNEKNNLATSHAEKVKEIRARYDRLAAQAVEPKSRPKKPDFKTPKVWGEQ
jgi:arylsulfatase A-like enzyme